MGLWQFTDRLMLNGKAFDGNWAYRDYPALTGEEEDTMTQAEVIALARAEAQKVYNENEARCRRPWPACPAGPRPRWSRCTGSWAWAGTGGPGQNTQLDASQSLYPRLDGDCQGAGEAGRPALAQAPGGNSVGGFWGGRFTGKLPRQIAQIVLCLARICSTIKS